MDESIDADKLRQQQRIRLTNTLFAAAGGLVLSGILVLCYATGALLLPSVALAVYLCLFWIGNGLLIAAVASGFNLRFSDPALSLVQMYWAISASVMALLFASEFDIAIYLLLMLILVFGIFRVSVRHFNYLAIYVVVAIFIAHMVRLQLLEPQQSLQHVLVQVLVFCFCTVILTRLCQAIVTLRNRLREQNEQLREALETKQQFMANMSHEIRTPMNGVLGMLDIVMRDDMPAKQRRYLGIAHSSALSLLTVINDILDFSKIEAGKLKVHPVVFDLGEFITDILDAFNAKAEAKGVELVLDMDADTPRHVLTDPMRLRQILNNLLSNALKFTDSGEVVVKVSAAGEVARQELHWQVKDTGIGIDQANLSRLFESFTQVDASASRAYGGAGLGLAICKQLCVLMGGDISVRSELGIGSCFEFTLPISPASAPGDTATVDYASITGKHVLVVDDNATNRLVLQHQLQRAGVAVATADSAGAALVHLSDHACDLALLDLQMPEVDGLALAHNIRALPRWRSLPLVVLSSAMDEVNRHKCEVLRIHQCLHKPVLPQRLYKAVADALEAPRGSSVNVDVQATQASLLPPMGAKVLLAEDNITNQQVAAVALAELGCQVNIAKNGAEAVQAVSDAAAKQPAFDLVLMDCQMPELDGYEATRQIRQLALASASSVPIVAVTANAMPPDRNKCLAAGMDDYIAKPFQIEALQEILVRWVQCPQAKRVASPGDANKLQDDSLTNDEVLECWDQAALRKLVRNKEERMVHLVSSFVGDIDANERAIVNAMESGDAPLAARLLHGLKGAAANLGARALPAALQQLESKISDSRPGAFSAADVLELRQQIARLKTEMGRFLGRPSE